MGKLHDGIKELSNNAKRMADDVEKALSKQTHTLTKLIYGKPICLKKLRKDKQGGIKKRLSNSALNHAEQEFIKSVVTKHTDFVLSHLAPKEVEMLIGAMDKFEVFSGMTIIEQGDVGDYLYVIGDGYIHFEKDGSEIGTATKGEVFGELALLYDCERSATAIADTDCVLYQASRETFREIQIHFVLENTGETQRFLRETKLFEDLPKNKIREMASFLFKKEFSKGDILRTKGEPVDEVYFLKEGRWLSTDISVENTKFADTEIVTPGVCFGDYAIVMDSPAAATLECLTDGVAYVLTKERFLHCMQGMDIHDIIRKSLAVKILHTAPLIASSDISRVEIYQMLDKFQDISLEPGEVLATIGDEVEPAMYFVETKNKGTGFVEITSTDGVTKILGPSEPFGFGKDTLILSNLDETDPRAAAMYGQMHRLINLDTDEGIHAAKRNIVDRNFVTSQFTVKAQGFETVHLRKLTLKDLKEIIFDPLRLGRYYEENQAFDVNIADDTLERRRLLGRGTFGEVWLCRDPSHDRPYALKIQDKRNLLDQHQVTGVLRETNIMRKMHHPFVMGLVHAQQDPYRLYMLMNVIQGGELSTQMRNAHRPHLSEQSSKFYAACMLEGLSYMHRREIIYRDLKGDNVLLDEDGYCVIIDLGFAKRVTDKTFTFCGTPIFIAPEILLNKGHDKMADIWSLGVMIFEMIFGTNPFFDYDDKTITQAKLFKAIVKGKLIEPVKQTAKDAFANTSAAGIDIIKKILVTNPNRRLGGRSNGDLDIRNHPWFAKDDGIDFGKLYRKELKAPWVPEISSPFDGEYFRPKPCPIRTVRPNRLTEAEQKRFEDFC